MKMHLEIFLLLLCEYVQVSYSGLLGRYDISLSILKRYKRDFVPPTSGFGSPLGGGAPMQRPPQPDPLRPEHVDPNNPYLESLSDPFYPSYGLGVGYQRPTILGGAINLPTGNVFHPTESVNGTLGFTQLTNFRFGTQGGPFYPWQDPKYAGSAKYLAMLQHQQQEQQAALADQAAQQAMSRSRANSPTDPFAVQNGPGSGGPPPQALQRQQMQQMSANMLATPPPLPPRFHAL